MWSSDFKSHAPGSIARQVMSRVLDEERHPHPPGLGLDIGLTWQSNKNEFVEKEYPLNPSKTDVQDNDWRLRSLA